MAQYLDLNTQEQAPPMVEIETTRFGTVRVEAGKILHFPEGLLGLPDHKDFCLMPHRPELPFFWLQSVTAPYLSFVVVNPLLGEPDYFKNLPEVDQQLFEGLENEAVIVLALVTVKPGNDPPLTMNLVGPIVVNLQTRMARQVVLTSTRYSCRHPLKI